MFLKLKKKNCSTSGIRHKKQITKNFLTKKSNFIKNIKHSIKSNSGRNSTGCITVRHKGGGLKKKSYFLNQKIDEFNAIVISIVNDSKKTSFISLNFDLKKKLFFTTIASRNLCSGSILKATKLAKGYFSGFYGFLENFPTGISIYNVSSKKNIFCFAKSAGVYCTLLQKQKSGFILRLPSGKIVKVFENTSAFIGKVSNRLHKHCKKGKAGINRNKNKRPTVRGIAMNPVDHPHGGRTNGGFHPVTPWGIPTLGKKTVKSRNVKI
jgi:large subunit ribosomal protein L2